MKFCECIGDMAKGATAVKGGVERVLVTREEMSIIEELHWADNWTQMKPFDSIDFDEEGWEIKVDTRKVCGIEFTRRPDLVLEGVWVSDERGLRLTQKPGGGDWQCRTCGDGPPLVRFGVTADEAVGRLLLEAEEVARMAARVLRKEAAGWQPIETAPVREQVLLCWAGEGRDPEAARLAKVAGYDTWVTPHGRQLRNPTHWMPIPPVPGGGE